MNRKLYRSKKDKIIGGVCGGLGKYFDIDPVLIRILFVFLTFFHGSGLIIYLILLIIVPQEPINIDEIELKDFTDISGDRPSNYEQTTVNRGEKVKKIFGIILLIIGSLLFLENFVKILDFEIIAPLIMILMGLYLIYVSLKKRGDKYEIK
jgi:phage shock protein C